MLHLDNTVLRNPTSISWNFAYSIEEVLGLRFVVQRKTLHCKTIGLKLGMSSVWFKSKDNVNDFKEIVFDFKKFAIVLMTSLSLL